MDGLVARIRNTSLFAKPFLALVLLFDSSATTPGSSQSNNPELRSRLDGVGLTGPDWSRAVNPA